MFMPSMMFCNCDKSLLCPICLWLMITLSVLLISVPCLCDQPRGLALCLNQLNVNNYTTYPDRKYHQLLYFSINNLRFTGLSIPKPKAIIVPTTKEQLINTVLCCKKESFEIRVRCGGHSYEGISSVVPNGTPFVIIEMMNLDQILVDLERGVAWVEGGATLGQTYRAIAQSSKTHGFSAGTCPTVGVGGQIAGGGFGLMSRKHGLAADNVVDALLVDAEGRVLDREAMGEDVFWAIRGGGGGMWGIIYAYKIQLVTVPSVVTGFVISRSGTRDRVATLVHKWQLVTPKLKNEFYISTSVAATFTETIGKELSATFRGFYLGPTRVTVSLLEIMFPELGVKGEDCEEMSWIESVIYFSGLEKGSSISELANRYLREKWYFKGKSDFVRTPIPLDGIKEVMVTLEKQPKGSVFMEPYGGIMDEIASDSIAFPHRKGNIFTIQYLVNWKEEDDEKSEEYIQWVRGFYDAMTPYVSSGPRTSYVNCIDLDLGIMGASNGSAGNEVEMARVWGEKYFLVNYDRLVRAKTLIDPHNVFRNQQGIPPLPITTQEQMAHSTISDT